jgi:hypothetical protein
VRTVFCVPFTVIAAVPTVACAAGVAAGILLPVEESIWDVEQAARISRNNRTVARERVGFKIFIIVSPLGIL